MVQVQQDGDTGSWYPVNVRVSGKKKPRRCACLEFDEKQLVRTRLYFLDLGAVQLEFSGLCPAFIIWYPHRGAFNNITPQHVLINDLYLTITFQEHPSLWCKILSHGERTKADPADEFFLKLEMIHLWSVFGPHVSLRVLFSWGNRI